MKRFFLTAAFALAAASTAMADSHSGKQNAKRELSAPIIRLTPVIKMNADTLALTAQQRADLRSWLATMPAKRKALEAEAMQARAALRQAILAGAAKEERDALAQKVGAYEVQLVTMRGNCVDHWRSVLTADQFAQAILLMQSK